MKRLPLLAALPLLCASIASASSLMSVGYFNGGGDVTAGPGGDINKLDVRQITHLNYSFGLIYNDEKDETNPALKDPAKLHQIWLSLRLKPIWLCSLSCVNKTPLLRCCSLSAAGGPVASRARHLPRRPARCLSAPPRRS